MMIQEEWIPEEDCRYGPLTIIAPAADGHAGVAFQGMVMSEFERRLVTGNYCDCFLDMKCVFHPDRTEIFYNTERYIRLDEVLKSGMIDAGTVLSVCGAFLEAVKECGDYLVTQEDLSFREETVFCTGDYSSVRFLYIPGYRNRISVRNKLIEIVNTAIEFNDEEDGKIRILSEYKNKLYMGSGDYRTLSMLTEEMLRKNVPEQEPFREMIDPETSFGNRKREKGSAVRFPVSERSPFRKAENGMMLGMPAEKNEFRENDNSKEKEHEKLGQKLKNLFSELVS